MAMDYSSVAPLAESGSSTKDFHTWIALQGYLPKSFDFLGYRWTKVALASRWIVVFGAPVETTALSESAKSEKAIVSQQISQPRVAKLGWTDKQPLERLLPHVAWAHSIDWSKTSLGPISKWSSQLRSMTNLVMQDLRPAVLFYGSDLIMIFKEAYVEFLGDHHPCLGLSARTALAATWSGYLEPSIAQNLDGKTVEQTDSAFHMVRGGFTEEIYFFLKFIPILDSNGATVGHYETLSETVSLEHLALV